MPAVSGDAAPLHQPVGVQHQHLAALERQLVLGAAAVRERAQRRRRRHLERPRLAAGDHQRREVARGRVLERRRVRVEHRVGGGRHRGLVERLHEPVDELERAARAVALDRVRVQRGAQPAHQRGGRDPVADHVADHDARPCRAAARSRRTSRRPPPRARGGSAPRRPRRRRRPAAWAAGCAGAPSTRRARARAPRTAARARSPAPRARRPAAARRGRAGRTSAACSEPDVQHADQLALDDQRHARAATRMPFSRRIGFRMSAWSTSAMKIATRSAAIRPAKPRPSGIRTPCSTSSSIPLAARATS